MVSSAQYISDEGANVGVIAVIGGKEIFIPLDPDNRHYQAILEWVAEGNTIQEAD